MVNNKKKFKDPVLKSFQIEKETNKELNKICAFYGIPQSQYIRQLIEQAINNFSNDLNELKQLRNEKTNERNLIDFEIEQINNNINTIIQEQKQNEKDNNILLEIMEIIKQVAINENGISKDRINIINKNRIRTSIILKECQEQGIKIIKENQKINSKTPKKKKEKEQITKVYNLFKRSYTNQYKYNNPISYLKADNERYKTICNKANVNYNDLLKTIEKKGV